MGRTFYSNRGNLSKLSNDEKLDLMLDLIYAFGIVKKPEETAIFLQDLLTANEIRNLSIRLRIAKLLLAGLTYQEIIKGLHTCSGTVTKVSLWLEQGGEGFKQVISKLPIKWAKPRNLPRGPIEFHLPELLLALAQYKLSEKNMGTVRRLSSNVGDKAVLDRSLRDEAKLLHNNRRGKG